MKPKAEGIPLDRFTWRRWRRAITTLLASEVGGRVKLMFGALLVCCSASMLSTS